MPADEEERYTRMLFQAVQDLTKQLATIQGDIKEDVAQLLRTYREDNHRAIMGIYTRLISIEDTIETERGSRVARQKVLDGELRNIHDNQRFWIRIAVVAGILALGVAIGWLVL